jgi:Zn finger protein HypA/HybF involved in hydrogenase expression
MAAEHVDEVAIITVAIGPLSEVERVGDPTDLLRAACTVNLRGPRFQGIPMSPESLYSANVCTQCQHASLVADNDPRAMFCALCGASNLTVPGARFIHDDLPIFAELERIVRDAQLSKAEAMLIAAELESVSQRWEPPELVLQRISPRLHGLRAAYDPKQEYPRLLLIVGMLLTIVCARMIGGAATSKPRLRPSGIRRLVAEGDAAEQASVRRRKSG